MTPIPLARAGPWFSAARASAAVPHRVPSKTAINRFNDGNGVVALRYLASDAVIALLEARALLRSFPAGLVAPGRPRTWTLFRYELAITPDLPILDFGDAATRAAANTTVQELTGDWQGYALRRSPPPWPPLAGVVSGGRFAPTQRLARELYSYHLDLVGFLAPSALALGASNLVLFHDQLPAGTITVTGRRKIRV